MELDIHNVASIIRSAIDNIDGCDLNKRYYRTLIIKTDKGEEIEISCWSNKYSDLIIKEED